MQKMELLFCKYRRALEIISLHGGHLKDDTYLLHLLSCTEAVVTTQDRLAPTGIQKFIQSGLVPGAKEEHLHFCLKLAAFTVDKHGSIDEIVPMLAGNLNDFFRSESPDVIASLLETLRILLQNLQATQLDRLTDLHWKLITGVWPNLSRLLSAPAAPTYHVDSCALACFVALLSLLLRCKAKDNDAINHPSAPNSSKLLASILSEYFDAGTAAGKVRLFKQLRTLLRITEVDEYKHIKNVLFEYILMLTDNKVDVDENENCLYVMLATWLELRSGPEVSAQCAQILDAGRPPAQMAVVEACCQHLRLAEKALQDTGGPALEILAGVIRERIFGASVVGSEFRRRLLLRTSVAELVGRYPALADLFIRLAGEDVVNLVGELAEYGQLIAAASVGLRALLQFLTVVISMAGQHCRLAPAARAALLRLLASQCGGQAELKAAACDLLSVELANENSSIAAAEKESVVEQYLPVLGVNIISTAQPWQLRDSAVQCLCSLLTSADGHRLTSNQTQLVLNLLRSLAADKNSFIRSSCYRLWAGLLVSGGLSAAEVEEQLVTYLTSCLLTDQEAIVRRGSVDLVGQLPSKQELVTDALLNKLETLMIHVLRNDFDWEVRLKSVQFWTAVLCRQLEKQLPQPVSIQQLAVSLEQQHLFTALQLGLTDYESSIQAAFRPLMAQVSTQLQDLQLCPGFTVAQADNINKSLDHQEEKSPSYKRRKTISSVPDFLDEDVDTVIEDIVRSEDRGLVADLETTASPRSAMAGDIPSVVAPLTWAQLQDLCNSTTVINFASADVYVDCPLARLDSVLEDILQSVEGVSMMEIVDCY